jgi:hypothetical protein
MGKAEKPLPNSCKPSNKEVKGVAITITRETEAAKVTTKTKITIKVAEEEATKVKIITQVKINLKRELRSHNQGNSTMIDQ